MPALATRLAPLVPWNTEVALGRAVEPRRSGNWVGAKVCGGEGDGPGRKALAALTERLARHATLPGPIEVKVVDSTMQNAFTLPGGRIVFSGR